MTGVQTCALPISAVFLKTFSLSWEQFWHIVSSPRMVASYKLTFGASLGAASINAVFGLIFAWVLVRYQFFGKKVVDALVDLPFALPTAVAGIALTAIYSGNGLLGQYLEPLGIKVAFTPLGILVALTFIGLPFVVRTVQPVLEDLDTELEEAAASLGACANCRGDGVGAVSLTVGDRTVMADVHRPRCNRTAHRKRSFYTWFDRPLHSRHNTPAPP